MTGYGTGARHEENAAVSVEVRTVNHRSLDLHVRLPREFGYLEPEIQRRVRKALSRGRVDVGVAIDRLAAPPLAVNVAAARAYVDAARVLRDTFGFEDDLDLKTILRLPGVVETRETGAGAVPAEPDPVAGLVYDALEGALEGVAGMRRREGEALAAEMATHLDSLAAAAESLRELLPACRDACRLRFEERLAEILPRQSVDPQRVAQELAMLLEKADISEELARLESHLGQYRRLLDLEREAGKKLDFLLQEMQRETNTMLAKSPTLEITRAALAAKADVEKLREQVQNVE